MISVHELLLQRLCLMLHALGVLQGSLLAALGFAHAGGQLGNALLHRLIDFAQLACVLRLISLFWGLDNRGMRLLRTRFVFRWIAKIHSCCLLAFAQVEFELVITHCSCHLLPHR